MPASPVPADVIVYLSHAFQPLRSSRDRFSQLEIGVRAPSAPITWDRSAEVPLVTVPCVDCRLQTLAPSKGVIENS